MNELIGGRELAVELCVLPRNCDFAVASDDSTGPVPHKVSPQIYQSKIMKASEFAEQFGKTLPEGMSPDYEIDVGELASHVMGPTLFTTLDLSKELDIAENEIERRIDLLDLEPDGEKEDKPAYHLTNVVPWILWRLVTVNQMSELMQQDRHKVKSRMKNVRPVAVKSLGNRDAKYYWLHQLLQI